MRKLRHGWVLLLVISGLGLAQALPEGVARIHYQRPDGDYEGWELHVWEDTTDSVTWADGLDIAGSDGYGIYWDVQLAEGAERVGFIVHRGDVKDPGPDMFLVPTQHGREIWLTSGSDEISSSLPLEPPEEGFARIHYFRPDGNYQGFELHVWEDTTDSVTWADGLDIAGETDFGVYWEIELAADAERVGFIVHRGDEKDPGPDMFLVLGQHGREIWVVSGSATSYSERPDIRLAGGGDLGRAQAHWVRRDTIAWETGTLVPGTRFALHVSPEAGLEPSPEGVSGGLAVPLLYDEAGLPAEVLASFPHLAGFSALRLPPEELDMVPSWLRGQVAVSMVSAGTLVDATGVQIPGVLDDLYAEAARSRPLGLTWQDGVPGLSVWAPTAQLVRLHLFRDAEAEADDVIPMSFDPATGIWAATGNPSWRGSYYLFEVTVYAPSTGAVEVNLVTDPYSIGLSANSHRSLIIDLDDPALQPSGWSELVKPPLGKPEDIVIYELHLRDFSISDPLVPAEHRGRYLAFTHPESYGMRHLHALQEAGLTHLHLLPTFDLATIEEREEDRLEPDIGLESGPSAATGPQAAVEAVRDRDGFNWGYDPYHYNVPEGSYATDPDGVARILEFRRMVQALNQAGLRVVVDVVYNHTNAAGQASRSVLDRVVPGYYHRLDGNGFVTTSTCCPNTATEHAMMERLMIDSVLSWATHYRVDGFRFDLMGHHMKRNMERVRASLDALDLDLDGVDGAAIYLYGEGWNFGEVADGARGINATQRNMAGTGIGTFNDRLRDAVRGGGPFDGGLRLVANQGFISGLGTFPNEASRVSPEDFRRRALLAADQIRVGLAGNLAAYTFQGSEGDVISGAEVDYNGSPAGYTVDPQENIVYVSKHDNQTLWDISQYKLPLDLPLADRVRLQAVGLSLVAFSQGVPFFHAGSDLLRSKSFDRDSYDSGDWFNRLDFSYRSNNFGVGLPVANVNRDNWQFMRDRLLDPDLLPGPPEIAFSADLFRDWLGIRRGSELFRLATAEDVQARVAFHNTGPNQVPGVIVMSLSDEVPGLPDLDPERELLVVVFNASPMRQTMRVPELEGLDLRLHAIQRASADEAVRLSAMYSASGRLSVPAMTTAVFELRAP